MGNFVHSLCYKENIKACKCAKILKKLNKRDTFRRLSGLIRPKQTVNTFVAFASGAQATGAVVRMIDVHGWIDSISRQASPVLDSTTVAENGMFSLRIDPSRIVNLQIDNGTAGSFIPFTDLSQFDGDTLYLDSVFTFKAKVDSLQKQNFYISDCRELHMNPYLDFPIVSFSPVYLQEYILLLP